MKNYRLTKTLKSFEEGNCTVYGISSDNVRIEDVSSDKSFVLELLERINRLGVEEALLCETVEDAVAEHFSL